MLLSMATELDFDSAGRILLPQILRDYAETATNITIIGAENHIEIWDTQKWNEHRNSVLLDIAETAEELDEL